MSSIVPSPRGSSLVQSAGPWVRPGRDNIHTPAVGTAPLTWRVVRPGGRGIFLPTVKHCIGSYQDKGDKPVKGKASSSSLWCEKNAAIFPGVTTNVFCGINSSIYNTWLVDIPSRR